MDRDALLSGTKLPPRVTMAKEKLPQSKAKPMVHDQPGHTQMAFIEPQNKQGQAPRNPRKRRAAETPLPIQWPAPPVSPAYMPPVPWQGWPMWPPMFPQPPVTEPFRETSPSSTPRQRDWRHRKAAMEDEERRARGEPPLKRKSKEGYRYLCSGCGQQKAKSTGHSQFKGKWYCPSMGMTLEEWKTTNNVN